MADVLSLDSETDTASPVGRNWEESALSAPINKFTVSLFDRLSQEAGEANVFVSPLSVSTALAMLLLGARNTSEEQLRTGLAFDALDEKDGKTVHHLFHELIVERIQKESSVTLSNCLLVQKTVADSTVLQKYKSDVQSLYSAKADDVNFASDGSKIMSDLNDFVKRNTKGLIEKILDEPPEPDTALILLNAIYFKGKWKEQFKKKLTKKMVFYSRGVKETETDFMLMCGEKFPHLSEKVGGEDTHVLELAYIDEHISMIIVLPEKRNGLKALLASNTFQSDLSSILTTMSAMKFKRSMDLFIPKFKLETKYSLNATLREMGMSDIFDPTLADLSGITGNRDLSVSLVHHKAVVEVDEEGTKAAAVTAVSVVGYCYTPPTEFLADHPFLFLIKDKKTGLILFIGKVEEFL